jgi:hypothetical protein
MQGTLGVQRTGLQRTGLHIDDGSPAVRLFGLVCLCMLLGCEWLLRPAQYPVFLPLYFLSLLHLLGQEEP